MWYVYRSVDAHKKHSEKAVYIILSSYLFESLLYLRKLIRSPDSQHKISRRSGSAAGKCWGRFSQSSEKNCLQLSQGRQPYSFYPAKIGACRISLQHPSTNSGHLKMNCGVVFYSLHWTNQKKILMFVPKMSVCPNFWPGLSTDSGAIKLRKSSDCAGTSTMPGCGAGMMFAQWPPTKHCIGDYTDKMLGNTSMR